MVGSLRRAQPRSSNLSTIPARVAAVAKRGSKSDGPLEEHRNGAASISLRPRRGIQQPREASGTVVAARSSPQHGPHVAPRQLFADHEARPRGRSAATAAGGAACALPGNSGAARLQSSVLRRLGLGPTPPQPGTTKGGRKPGERRGRVPAVSTVLPTAGCASVPFVLAGGIFHAVHTHDGPFTDGAPRGTASVGGSARRGRSACSRALPGP
jgi:hypothetical protein